MNVHANNSEHSQFEDQDQRLFSGTRNEKVKIYRHAGIVLWAGLGPWHKEKILLPVLLLQPETYLIKNGFKLP